MIDDGLQLNLVTTPIEKSKPIKRKAPTDDSSGTANDEFERPLQTQFTGGKGRNIKKRKLGDETGVKHDKYFSHTTPSTGVVSSLFNSNPEVPQFSRSEVNVVGEQVFAAETFDKLPLHPFMISNLKQCFEIKKMTEVQKASVPVVLSGKDALIKSQTGTGKTLAYALPIIHKLQEIRPKIKRSDGIFALIIVPTRELTIQVYEWFTKLVRSFTWIVAGSMMGGEKKKSEKSRIRKGINIMITTPGRLLDHIQHTTNLSLANVKWLVIDEADRLLDMGYEKDIASIITSLNEQEKTKRQTVMLSATLSHGVEKLAGLTLTDPEIIDVAAGEDEESFGRMVTPAGLHQNYLIVPTKLKLVTLAAFILWKCRATAERKMLIFMATQDLVDFHAKLFKKAMKAKDLSELNLIVIPDQKKAASDDEDSEKEGDGSDDEDDDPNKTDIYKLHGNMSQEERTQMFRSFKEAHHGVLLATDVAARGLDLPQVDWIVQYNAPARAADYVHRVGRTARIGEEGHSLLFLLPSEVGYISVLDGENLSLSEMTVDSILSTLAVAPSGPRKGKKKPFSLSVEDAATSLQLHFENRLLNDEILLEAARNAFVSYVRSYASYPLAARTIFNFHAVHLGHVAKSLALRETPSSLGGFASSSASSSGHRGRGRGGGGGANRRFMGRGRGSHAGSSSNTRSSMNKRRNPVADAMSEFSSGFETSSMTTMKNVKNVRGGGRKQRF